LAWQRQHILFGRFALRLAIIRLQFQLQAANPFEHGCCLVAKPGDVLVGDSAVLPDGAGQFTQLLGNLGCASHDFVGGFFDLFGGGCANAIDSLNGSAGKP
jgi:hypothetical protein